MWKAGRKEEALTNRLEERSQMDYRYRQHTVPLEKTPLGSELPTYFISPAPHSKRSSVVSGSGNRQFPTSPNKERTPSVAHFLLP